MVSLPELVQNLYKNSEWNPEFHAPLAAVGVVEPQGAWKVLGQLAVQANFEILYPKFFPNLLAFLERSFDSDIALKNFERLTLKIPDKENLYSLLSISPDFLKTLLILFSGSQVLTDTLLSNPTYIDWLSREEILSRPKKKDDLYRDFYAMAGRDPSHPTIPSLLRKFKKREYIRIGLRDLLGRVELQEHLISLSDLADVCLQIACDYADETLKQKYGIPMYTDAQGNLRESEFTVLSMGKLGGRELNYSSDIDLIYIYTSSMGETRPATPGDTSIRVISNHEFHIHYARLLTKTINEITEDGNVFRVDLDLRPEGKSGEIANSLTSCEVYYESWGRTWERQALIKARVSAGSESLGKEFFQMIRPFIYRRSLDFNAVQEIKSLKKKVDQDLKKKNLEKGHIKLGYGGIREIEFIVQAYQLLFGGRDKGLRNQNTLITLSNLKEREMISTEDAENLRQAYVFLRNLENRVQITFGLQTYHLPKQDKDLAVLARKMGIQGKVQSQLVHNLNLEFDHHTTFVGKLFDRLFVEDADQQKADQVSRRWEEIRNAEEQFTANYLRQFSFKDPEKTFAVLKRIRDGSEYSHPSEKSIRDFYSLMPNLLDISQTLPNPTRAVENLERFIEASAARDTYLGVFNENEKFLELILILFGGSDALSQLLIKQPNLIDVLSNRESMYRFKAPEKMKEELEASLGSCSTIEEKNLALRKFKNGEELRIGLRYLISETDLPATLSDLSHLAELYLQTLLEFAVQETGRGDPAVKNLDRFAIIGLGKLGGRELNFGSDLDIVFVYEESPNGSEVSTDISEVGYYSAVAQKIYQLSTQATPAGPGYEIDTDLRPEGSRGALVLSLNGYEDYFKTRGQIWEQQAMTRARWVAGNRELGDRFLDKVHDFTFRPKLEYGNLIEITRLRERMETELAKESKKGKNVKLGYGGLADIEFTLQILQMMHGKKYSRLRTTNSFEIIATLSAYGILSYQQADALTQNYYFMRNLECSLRLFHPRASNHLPQDDEGQAVLARMLRYPGKNWEEQAQNLMADYERVTKDVREMYRSMVDNLLRTSL